MSARKLFAIVALSWAALVLVSIRVPQGIFADPSHGLKALLQYLEGVSPSVNHVVMPSAGDVSTLEANWIYWWPPGPQLAAYPFASLGLPLGSVLRGLTVLSILVGAIGWMRWFLLFRLPAAWNVFFAALLPWHHYASACLSRFYAESFLFALAPWILLAALGAPSRTAGRPLRIALTALFIGHVYVFKYTGIYLAAGAFVYWMMSARVLKSRGFLFLAAAAFVAPFVALNFTNRLLCGSCNPILSTLGIRLQWADPLFWASYPAMTLADGDSLWSYIMLHPRHGLETALFGKPLILDAGSVTGMVAGLPGAAFLAALVLKGRDDDEPARLAKTVFGVGMAGVLATLLVSEAALYQARYFVPFTLPLVPWALREALAARPAWLRRASLGMFAIYVVVPLVYGFVAASGKALKASPYVYGPSGIYNPAFAPDNVPRILDELTRGTGERDIWYADPLTALDMRGNVIIRYAEFIENFDEKFLTSKAVDLHVLLPAWLESAGKGEAVRRQFAQAGEWTKKEIDGGRLLRWDTRLDPAS